MAALDGVVRYALCALTRSIFSDTVPPMEPQLSPVLVRALDKMPAFPDSVQRILAMTRDMQCAPKDLVAVIENDPLMAARVLRVVNTAYYGLGQKLTSIGHAVVYLGLNTIKNIALSIAAIGVLPHFKVGRFESQAYLAHSLATAAIARQLALRVGHAEPMDAFIAALLHDLGKVVLALHMEAELQRALEYSQWHDVPLHQALRTTLGCDHAHIGAELLQRWQFAPDIVHTVRCQCGDPAPDTVLAASVFAANQISKRRSLGDPSTGAAVPLPDMARELLGAELDALDAQLGDVRTLCAQVQVYAHG